jgi:GntR family transcriptional repressor for pyruvate dehydrogenase complex
MRNVTHRRPRSVKTRPRRSDDVLRRVVGLIFDGHLSPGTRLPSERKLSVTLQVSRTTLRDALNRLEARGYIERRPKSGNFVCTAMPPTMRQPIEEVVGSQLTRLADVLEIRKGLELWAIAQAVKAPDARLLRQMKTVLAAMKRLARFRTDEQFEQYREADLEFHRTLARMTRNSIYVHLIDFLHQLIRHSMAISRELVAGNYGERNLSAHERIVAALTKGDPSAARQAMLDHFALLEQYLRTARNDGRAAQSEQHPAPS